MLDYHLTNTGTDPLLWLWASHPQFTVTAQIELMLPPNVKAVINILDDTVLGDVHQRHSWPPTTRLDSSPLALNRIGPASLHTYRKFYVSPDYRPDWAMMRKPKSGDWLRVDWDSEKIPISWHLDR